MVVCRLHYSCVFLLLKIFLTLFHAGSGIGFFFLTWCLPVLPRLSPHSHAPPASASRSAGITAMCTSGSVLLYHVWCVLPPAYSLEVPHESTFLRSLAPCSYLLSWHLFPSCECEHFRNILWSHLYSSRTEESQCCHLNLGSCGQNL